MVYLKNIFITFFKKEENNTTIIHIIYCSGKTTGNLYDLTKILGGGEASRFSIEPEKFELLDIV